MDLRIVEQRRLVLSTLDIRCRYSQNVANACNENAFLLLVSFTIKMIEYIVGLRTGKT